MKLSERTLTILQNFSSINASIKIEKGSKLRTKTEGAKAVVAFAEIEEDFEHEVNIYDLNKFRKIISLFSSPEIEIKTTVNYNEEEVASHALIKDSKVNKSFKYCFSAASLIDTVGDLKTTPEYAISFEVSSDTILDLISTSTAASLDSIAVESDGKSISMSAYNESSKNEENKYSIEVGEGNGDVYKMVIKKDHLKLLSGDYTIDIAKAGVARFTNTTMKVEYYIALAKASTYKEA